MNKVLWDALEHVKLDTGGADAKGRNSASSYVAENDEKVGCLKLVKVWHAIGHTVSDSVRVKIVTESADQVKYAANVVKAANHLSHMINRALELIDEDQYKALMDLQQRCVEKYAHVEALNAIDPLVYEGRAIMFNRQTPAHVDKQDPKRSWATMITLGDFTAGGNLRIERLNLTIRYLPRDVVILRGRLLQHEVQAWSGGRRISIAHFTHESLWKEFGMTCP
ncbi:hypothetical protein BDN72DRAFT_774126 [Pluteus cervinus]|uniref:Uncharacterized protein n=1 Tax=Pluteus cervinus TaxID=181527 RepID=A0ACD3AHQ0_9AGAR|nr:hypothetical protein BDN72DRAFT_774126 [Pluteus cervinus]